jgi:acyl transferase domain-containing protein
MNIAFLFTGQGSQYSAMGRPFYDRYDEFRAAVDRCADYFADHLDVSMRDLVLEDGHTESLEHTLYQQPALFTFEYALARLWISQGVIPDVLLGHSLGEIVAVAVAECLGLSDAVALVANRARFMHDCGARGSMLAVAAAVDRVLQVVSASSAGGSANALAVAAINCVDRCVISGEPGRVSAARQLLQEAKIPSSPLKVSHAFHSPLMTPAAHALGEFTATLRFRAPATTVVSALDGRELGVDTLADPQHWMRHCLQPVNFLAAIETVTRHGRHTFVEIGPSHTLLKFAQRCVPLTEHRWLRSAAPTDVVCGEFQSALSEVMAGV